MPKLRKQNISKRIKAGVFALVMGLTTAFTNVNQAFAATPPSYDTAKGYHAFTTDNTLWKATNFENSAGFSPYGSSNIILSDTKGVKSDLSTYCIDLYTHVGTNTTNDTNKYYTLEELENLKSYPDANYSKADQLRTIVANSYPMISIEQLRTNTGISNLTPQEASHATQLAIWKIVHGGKGIYPLSPRHSVNDGYYDYAVQIGNRQAAYLWSGDLDVEHRIYNLYEYLMSKPVQPSVKSANLLYSPLTMEESNGSIKVSYSYKVADDNGNKTINSDGTDVNIKRTYKIGGVSFTPTDESAVLDSDGWTSVSFTIPATNIVDGVSIDVYLAGIQDISKIDAIFPASGDRKSTQTLISSKNLDQIVYLNATRTAVLQKPVGYLDFVKKDDVGQPLQGATVEIKNTRGDVIVRGTTDLSGKLTKYTVTEGSEYITSDGKVELPSSSYYLVETVAPAGFEKSSKQIDFTITTGQTISKELANTKKIVPVPETDGTGGMKFLKLNAKDSSPVKGAKIGVYLENGTPVFSGTTDANGRIITKEVFDENYVKKLELDPATTTPSVLYLKLGKYYLQEEEAPAKFIKNDTKYYFEITQKNIDTNAVIDMTATLKNLNIDDAGKLTFTKTNDNGSVNLY